MIDLFIVDDDDDDDDDDYDYYYYYYLWYVNDIIWICKEKFSLMFLRIEKKGIEIN